MKTIHTKHAPAAIGLFTGKAGGRIYISFRTNRYRPGRRKIIVSDIAGQTEQVCKNIKAILKKQKLLWTMW